jgi:hypothetical protein
MGSDATAAAPVTTMACAMMFGTIIFATAAMTTRGYLTADHTLFKTAANPRSSPLDIKSLNSLYALLYHLSVFGLILFYAYICEHHPPYAHADKNYDSDMFFFCTFLLFVVSAFTWRKHVNHDEKAQNNIVSLDDGAKPIVEPNDKTEVLNRDQTEEWKGWMQFMFLLYHYYHAEPVYNSIRIMITCYVWMTGFGNFSFFYLKADFGSIRVMQMLWRLNFLVLFLCLTQGTTFILYYICLLHTYYFFMVYIIMRIGHQQNHTKWWVRIKLGALAFAIFLVWDCNLGLFQVIHFPFFGKTPMMGATAGSMWEWYFRSSLDHWSTFLGMIFALNFPISSLFYRKLEAQPFWTHFLGKAIPGIGLLFALHMWVTGPFMQNKFDYNQTNSYYGFIPLITYIYFRNLTPWLRNHSLDLLHQIGKTTLETYLMQHHIWLTSNAKSLLTLIPGWPKVNFLLVSLLYVFFSRRLYSLTLYLRGMMLPDNKQACIKNLTGMGVVISFFCILSTVLSSFHIMSLKSVGVISGSLGYILFQFLLTFTARTNGIIEGEKQHMNNKDQLALSTPYLGGAIAIMFVGIFWNTMALKGETRIQLLPSTCSSLVNNGNWVKVNGCDEGFRGEAFRSMDIGPETTCSSQNGAYVWGWLETASKTHCRFKQRDVKTLKKNLLGRTIYFAGDSEVRYLYHSFVRQLGVSDAGAYDTTVEKHADINNKIGDIEVDFLWAEYSSALNTRAQEILEMPVIASEGQKKRPDLVVFGSGPWDKLKKYDTTVEQQTVKNNYEKLASLIEQLTKAKIPVVWITPTTINTAALPPDEKREKINEEEMAKFRQMQATAGMGAASFTIHGPSFTKGRVSESFDGVHYPHQVYSAGTQILCNSMDWLLPTPLLAPPREPPQPGSMGHPILGFAILVLCLFGIVGFDGFLGFSYLAVTFAPSMAPFRLYDEAFSSLHKRKGLPPLDGSVAPSIPDDAFPSSKSDVEMVAGSNDVEEVAPLISDSVSKDS